MGRLRTWALGLLCLALLAPSAQAEKITERTRQQQSVEAQRTALRQRLATLQQDIGDTETAKNRAVDALAVADSAISDANRALRELADEQKQTENKLAGLTKAQSELARSVDAQHRQLAKLLREQYVAGNEDRIKLLLSGDNPNRINRDMQYMGYVSQAQDKIIRSLRSGLQAVEANKADTENTRQELEEIATDQRAQKAALQLQQSQRATLLAQLSNRLAGQKKEAGEIERDDRRLGGLVERLEKLIEEQQKTEAAEKEKTRQAAISQEKERAAARESLRESARETARKTAQDKERERERSRVGSLAKARPTPDVVPLRPAPALPSNGRNDNRDAIDNDEPPPQSIAKNELAHVADIQDSAYPKSFRDLRGLLRLPVRGELTARFGSKRGDGPASKGIFIRASEGTEIKTVAAGRVIFAEWLRGFGNLIIVDHGRQYLTIYGNNQSVLRRAGDAVKAGDVIAGAGNSGSNEQSGLYFEMRHQGRAFDPLGWVTTR